MADLQSDSIPRKTPGKRGAPEGTGADAGAVETKNAHDDPGLQAIIDAWPTLPDAIKGCIVVMVTAARRDGAEG